MRWCTRAVSVKPKSSSPVPGVLSSISRPPKSEATSPTGSPPCTSNKAAWLAPFAGLLSLTPSLSSSVAPSAPDGLAASPHRHWRSPGRSARRPRRSRSLDALALPANLLNETDLLQARAWAAAAAGDLPGARDQLEAAAGLGEEIGDLIGATSALHGLARLGRARHVAARLATLAAEVDGDLVAARAAYANAIAARDSEALEKVSGDFEVLGANLYAAEARAEAAVLLRRTGRARDAAADGAESGRLLARCEGAVTPAVQAITARVFLTPGELDAARQAAAGRSSRQIAADMHLSVRTVESRLQRVYEKLGVCGRRELVGALADRPAA